MFLVKQFPFVQKFPQLSTYVGGMTAFAPVEHPQAALDARLHLRTVQEFGYEGKGGEPTGNPSSASHILTTDRKVHGADGDEQRSLSEWAWPPRKNRVVSDTSRPE